MRIDLPSGTPAELVRPPGEPTLGVVVAPDIFGLRPLFVDICTTAGDENGWAVCAPEPFPGRELGDVDERFAEVGKLDDERVIGDLEPRPSRPSCSDVALIGFCMGGMYALKAAGLSARFDRVVAFYGMIRVPEEWQAIRHGEPLDARRRDGVADARDHRRARSVHAARRRRRARGRTGHRRALPGRRARLRARPDRPAHRPDDAADAWQPCDRRSIDRLTDVGAGQRDRRSRAARG